MKGKELLGIKFIGWFQVFGAIMVLLTLNVQQTPAFNVRFGVPSIPELLVRLFVGGFGIIIAYGYLKQNRWGYWSMLIYSIMFCFISINQINQYGSETFVLNAIYSGMVALYTFINRKYFIIIK